MNLLGLSGIVGTAYAAGPAATQAAPTGVAGLFSMLWLPLLLIVIFYFMLIRPQAKRAKEHRQLLEGLSVGDEVLTTGGIIGKIVNLKDSFVLLEIAKGTEIIIQKASIASILPKGTFGSL